MRVFEVIGVSSSHPRGVGASVDPWVKYEEPRRIEITGDCEVHFYKDVVCLSVERSVEPYEVRENKAWWNLWFGVNKKYNEYINTPTFKRAEIVKINYKVYVLRFLGEDDCS